MLHAQASRIVLIDQFLKVLQSLPEAHAELGWPASVDRSIEPGHDAEVALHVAGKSIHVLVELKKAVYPRDVRQVLWQVRELAHKRQAGQKDDEALAVLVAESISPGAKELLRAERVGYYDSGGSLYLPAPGAYFYIDKPPPKSLARSMRSLFTGRRAQVLQGLLGKH